MNNQVSATESAVLCPEHLAASRETLHEQRLFRQAQLRQIAAPSQPGADHMRWQPAASQIEVHVRLVAAARMVHAHVEAALDRMDQGRYGRCHLCAKPIALDRLKIVPYVRDCARCQQLREAGQ
ncbi:TraR/DksA family transcriptional regulator [Streptomyces mirabilis]|uniref:TraR/DksA family transcriptional regulator n=2 Tax=Streptomyces mirabilis TaxID=68239 RepID=UPI00382CA5AA